MCERSLLIQHDAVQNIELAFLKCSRGLNDGPAEKGTRFKSAIIHEKDIVFFASEKYLCT